MNILKNTTKWVLYFFALLLMSSIALLPLLVLFRMSLASPSSTMQQTLTDLSINYWGNYANAWSKSHLGTAVLNSCLITFGALAVLVFVSAMAGYAIARSKRWYNKAFEKILLISMMIPSVLSTVPLYIIMKFLHGINTYWAMILLLAAQSLPFSIFVYSNFIKGLPKDIEEAAVIDGCTPFGAFWRVVFPLMGPVTASVVIIQGVSIWNNYGQAVYFLTKSDMQTLPLAISGFFSKYSANWSEMAAAAIIGIIPTIAVFVLFQKYFIKGLTNGAVKG